MNEAPEYLNAALFTASPSLAAAAKAAPEWVSPLASDDYAECWNERFLERLGLLQSDLASFSAFWPFTPAVGNKISQRGTPHWDALARVPLDDGRHGVVMVEAKAHRGELVKPSDRSKAEPASLARIKKSFTKARDYFGVSPSVPSLESRYYQVGNRFAHLYWMNEVTSVPTWLVWVMVVDDPVWPDSLTAPQWHDAWQRVKNEVGMPASNPLADKITAVYLPSSPE